MTRFLYAGYLAFAIYIIYPMIQNYLSVEAACLHDVASAGATATGGATGEVPARGSQGACSTQARIGAFMGRSADTH